MIKQALAVSFIVVLAMLIVFRLSVHQPSHVSTQQSAATSAATADVSNDEQRRADLRDISGAPSRRSSKTRNRLGSNQPSVLDADFDLKDDSNFATSTSATSTVRFFD